MICPFKWVRLFFFSSRRRHTRSLCDWSSDVCSSDLVDKRAVRAAQVSQHEARVVAHDPGMAGGHVEVAFGIAADVGQRVSAEADVRLAEGLHLPDARAGEELELGAHGVRLTR